MIIYCFKFKVMSRGPPVPFLGRERLGSWEKGQGCLDRPRPPKGFLNADGIGHCEHNIFTATLPPFPLIMEHPSDAGAWAPSEAPEATWATPPTVQMTTRRWREKSVHVHMATGIPGPSCQGRGQRLLPHGQDGQSVGPATGWFSQSLGREGGFSCPRIQAEAS